MKAPIEFQPHPTNIDLVRVTAICCDCGKPTSFDIHESEWFSGLAALRKGALTQHAFPKLSRENRELLVSRFCPSCFDAICHD